MDFKLFQAATAKQFERMAKHQLFRVDVSKDALWDTYLGSFPEGSNPIYKERTHHDCNCCKQFIRAVGNAVAIIDGKIESIWNCEVGDPNYQVVTDAMAALVQGGTIKDVFMHFEATAGTRQNFEDTVDGVKTWNHFFVNIPKEYVMAGSDIASYLGLQHATHGVFKRGLDELTQESIDTVLDLISQNTLYRGEEQRFAVEGFGNLKAKFDKLTPLQKEIFAWEKFSTVIDSVSRIRNTAIGTLLVDLSEGVEIDRAVASFEAKVAPANYKRPTAVVTKSMITAAKKTIEEQGLTSALERRYANAYDITVNNLLFVDRSIRKRLNSDVFDDLSDTVAAKPKKSSAKVESVTIEKFINDILPKAESLELLVEGKHSGNFVSLIAPVDPTAKNMFKWDNRFSWSYNGEMADSIKERVKKAGGTVEGDLCCRLAWDYTDDLDFHMREPSGGHVYYGTRKTPSSNGGILDVDANGGSGMMAEPVENIFYKQKGKMESGVYKLYVHNYNRRSTGLGFDVEVEFNGELHSFAHEKVISGGATVAVADIVLKNGGVFEIKPSIPSTLRSKVMWGVKTQEFQRVSAVMLSPNFWDDKKVGNKHFFFMLANCANDGKARGFFNEFLREDLLTHRKVIEMVGAKMKTEEATDQLSGLGFSSTARASIQCRVKGAFSRVIEITF